MHINFFYRCVCEFQFLNDLAFHAGKSWDDIIPEAERQKVEQEEINQQLQLLNLPPRQRKTLTQVCSVENTYLQVVGL